MARDPVPSGEGASGNTFYGPAPFQVGSGNVQNNHFYQQESRRRPLVLAGAAHTTRTTLAAAIRGNWDAAKRQFFEGTATAHVPSEGRQILIAWLQNLDGLAPDELATQIELIDHRLRNDELPSDLKLLHLLCWLDPEGQAVWRGAGVTLESLSKACRIGRLEESGPEWELYRDLCQGGLLDALSGFTVLRTLRGTQQAWDEVWKSWRQLVARIPYLPREPREWAENEARGLLLAALLPDPATAEWMRTASERVTPPPTGAVEWYDWLRARDGGSSTPIGWLVRTDLAAFAAVEWNQQTRQAARDRERQQMLAGLEAAGDLRDRQWADYEARRLSLIARMGAVARAALWLGAWCAAGVAVAWLVWGWAAPEVARTVSWLLVVLTLAAYAGGLPRFVRLGAAYRPPLRYWQRPAPADEGRARRGLIRAGAGLGAVLILGQLHEGGFIVMMIFYLPWPVMMFRAARGGGLRDWDDDHQERQRDYASRRAAPGTIPQSIARSVQSPSPRDRADGYMAYLRQFTGLSDGGEDGTDRENDPKNDRKSNRRGH